MVKILMQSNLYMAYDLRGTRLLVVACGCKAYNHSGFEENL